MSGTTYIALDKKEKKQSVGIVSSIRVGITLNGGKTANIHYNMEIYLKTKKFFVFLCFSSIAKENIP